MMFTRLTHYLLIVALVLLAYSSIWDGDFVFDDQTLIRDNPYIAERQSLSSYLAQEDGIVDPFDKGSFHTGYYRPLLNITYYIDYRIFGMKAYGFRASNVMLHLLTCFILYELLLIWTGRRTEVFCAVLLFAVHPAQTETVSIIVSRNNILATLFLTASCYGYHVWWEKRRSVGLGVSLLAFIGAVFSKEFGLMTLPVLFFYQRLVASEKNLVRETASYMPYLIIAGIYFALRHTVVQTSIAIPADIGMRILYVPYLIAYHLKIIFLPAGLHSFAVAYPPSLLESEVIGSFVLCLILGGLLIVWRKERWALFAAASFFLALLPVLNLIDKASVSLVAMRWLYLPMSFLALAGVPLLAKINEKRHTLRNIIVAAAVIYCASYSYTLNDHLWHDQETFLRQEVQHFANNLYMGDYAEMMLNKKAYRESEYFFRKALSGPPYLARNYINYGALLIETQRPREALVALEKARPLTMGHKDRSDWNNNMGAALVIEGRYRQARPYLLDALALAPQNESVNRNWAYLLFREGDMKEAERYLHVADSLRDEKLRHANR